MLEHLTIRNFKSAHEVELAIGALTVLTGLNGSGKSTALQSLALLKQSLDTWPDGSRFLLRGPLVQAGRSEDVLFENSETDNMNFDLILSEGNCNFRIKAVDQADTLPMIGMGDAQEALANLFSRFQFIQADRLIPATQYLQASTPDQESGWLGCKGEYTVDFLHRNADQKVSRQRICPRDNEAVPAGLLDQVAPTDKLIDQTAGWLQHLSPGVRPRAQSLELADTTSLRFEYTGVGVDSGSRQRRPTNVGFGLTYCLPIIVACLSAPAGSLLLLENPEAHLHPRGQSALGSMIALCAADGVQIIVETHSDHLLNGIRIAVRDKAIKAENVGVHFFHRDVESGESKVTSPMLLENGRFDDWPDGFFDEWSKALDKLLG